jgi:hypothetical protein
MGLAFWSFLKTVAMFPVEIMTFSVSHYALHNGSGRGRERERKREREKENKPGSGPPPAARGLGSACLPLAVTPAPLLGGRRWIG